MTTVKKREQRRLARMKKRRDVVPDDNSLGDFRHRFRPGQNDPEMEVDPTGDDDESEAEEIPEFEIVEKHYDEPMPGPTSYTELDAAKEAREQAYKVREETYTVQELVSNIAYSQMTPDEKSKAIVSVGEGFGSRLKSIVKEKVEKEFIDMDLLQLQAILAIDSRHTSVIEKATDFLAKTFTKVDAHSKTFLRMLLKETADNLQDPQEDGNGHLSRENIPELIQKAKDAGIGQSGSIMIEKDATGNWRAVLFPTNNFKDRDGEIVSDAAHQEYVEWVNKNMDCAPVFATWHKPGTARTNPMDFVGYENGIMITSLPLTENEAARLLKMQTQVDIGLSIGGIALERDGNIITKYRMFEVSDLPLERAANPFTELELISKEAQMDMQKYLAGMIGDEEKAKSILAKMALTQAQLRKNGVEEKEVKTSDTPAAPVPPAQPEFKLDELVEKLSKELGMEQLSTMIAGLIEQSEKIPVLEAVIKEMAGAKEDALAEMINPPASKSLVWLKSRPTQDDKNVLDESKEEDKKLKKSVPELGWLSEATGTQPVQA